MTAAPLRVRWLGRVPYREALAVQTALFEHGDGQHLLLLEHPHVFTHGRRADLANNLRCEPAAVGAGPGADETLVATMTATVMTVLGRGIAG